MARPKSADIKEVALSGVRTGSTEVRAEGGERVRSIETGSNEER